MCLTLVSSLNISKFLGKLCSSGSIPSADILMERLELRLNNHIIISSFWHILRLGLRLLVELSKE